MKKSDIAKKVQAKENFSYAGTLKGKNKNNVYIVYSYNTPILVRINGNLYINKQQYSVTTSKHLNLALGSTVLTTESVLRRLIKGVVEEEKKDETNS